MNITNELAGKFRMVAVNAETGEERVVADWFDNLILDSGLNRIGTGAVAGYCHVGSGSTAPVASNTAMQSFVASTNTVNSSETGVANSSPYYGYFRLTYRFGQGAAAGNLSEVGIGWGASESTLFSRALIKDSGGNPTTITVLSNEFLDVTYELRNYAPASDSTFTATIGGVTHNCTLRAAYVTDVDSWGNNLSNYPMAIKGYGLSVFVRNGALGDITSSPDGSTGVANTWATDSYSSGSYTMTGYSDWGLNDGNLSGGITALVFRTWAGSYQCSFSPAIAKDNTKTLRLNVSVTWARKTL